jgi:hypothetical protein
LAVKRHKSGAKSNKKVAKKCNLEPPPSRKSEQKVGILLFSCISNPGSSVAWDAALVRLIVEHADVDKVRSTKFKVSAGFGKDDKLSTSQYCIFIHKNSIES